jgi:predicted nucleic acid-binding OB-fold protein
LDINEWIQIDPNYRQQIELKKILLKSSRRKDLFIYKDEAYAGAMEILKMLIEYLPNQYPNMFQTNHSKTKIINLITKQIFNLTESDHLHPLEIASFLVQEDLVIMQQNPNLETYHANVIQYNFNY